MYSKETWSQYYKNMVGDDSFYQDEKLSQKNVYVKVDPLYKKKFKKNLKNKPKSMLIRLTANKDLDPQTSETRNKDKNTC